MLIVLLILGLVGGLVLSNGPPHSATLDLRAGAGGIAEALRLARSQAIATGRRQSFMLDAASGRYGVRGAPFQTLPPQLARAMVSNAGEARRAIAAISFAPDGGASGGEIDIAEGQRRVRIGVDWLTGRVSVDDGSADGRR